MACSQSTAFKPGAICLIHTPFPKTRDPRKGPIYDGEERPERQLQPVSTAPQPSEIKSFGSQHGHKSASLRFRHPPSTMRGHHPAQTLCYATTRWIAPGIGLFKMVVLKAEQLAPCAMG